MEPRRPALLLPSLYSRLSPTTMTTTWTTWTSRARALTGSWPVGRCRRPVSGTSGRPLDPSPSSLLSPPPLILGSCQPQKRGRPNKQPAQPPAGSWSFYPNLEMPVVVPVFCIFILTFIWFIRIFLLLRVHSSPVVPIHLCVSVGVMSLILICPSTVASKQPWGISQYFKPFQAMTSHITLTPSLPKIVMTFFASNNTGLLTHICLTLIFFKSEAIKTIFMQRNFIDPAWVCGYIKPTERLWVYQINTPILFNGVLLSIDN